MMLEKITETSRLYHYHRFLSKQPDALTAQRCAQHKEESATIWEELANIMKQANENGVSWGKIDEAEEAGKFAARAEAREHLTQRKTGT